MLQSERLSKSLLAHATVDDFSPRLHTFSMGSIYDKQLAASDQPREVLDSSSNKVRRKRRVHSTGSAASIDVNNLSSTCSKLDNNHTPKYHHCLETSSNKTVTFSPDKGAQKTDQTNLGKLERASQPTNVVMICESELQNLKDLVLRHLDIVKEQQEIIVQKDKVIAQLRRENITVSYIIHCSDPNHTLQKHKSVDFPLCSPRPPRVYSLSDWST